MDSEVMSTTANGGETHPILIRETRLASLTEDAERFENKRGVFPALRTPPSARASTGPVYRLCLTSATLRFNITFEKEKGA